MNVLFDKWLPVERLDGSRALVAPIELPGTAYVRVVHPRSDYSVLATELLVDIFQTLCQPRSRAECRAYVKQTLTPDLLEFEKLRHAFELAGEGARFLQAHAVDKDALVPASALFFEAPGENTLRLNKDLFVSRDAMVSICDHCAPIALYMAQSHARMGGNGYRTGPRETSVLAALVEGDTLWETVCLNLLPVDWFDAQVGTAVEDVQQSFPWTRPAELLDKTAERSLADFGRFGVLWWLPVSLRLQFSPNHDRTPCAACGEVHASHVRTLSRRATAASLAGAVRHPRTGWNPNGNKGAGRCIEVPKEGFTFEHWQALTVGASVGDSLPAWAQLDWRQAEKVRLRLFGFAMNQMTPLYWLDETAPVMVPQDESNREALKESAQKIVEPAQKAVAALGKALGNADFPLRTTPAHACLMLWDALSSPLRTTLAASMYEGLMVEALEQFQRDVCAAALRIFDRITVDHGDNVAISRGLLARRATLSKKLRPKK